MRETKKLFRSFLWRFRSSEIPLKWVSHKFTQPKWRHRNKVGKLYNIFIDILIKLKAVMIGISSQLRCSPAWLTLLSLTSLCLVWLIFSSLSPADVSPSKQHNNRQTRPQQASLKPTQCFGDYDFSNQYHRSPSHNTHITYIKKKVTLDVLPWPTGAGSVGILCCCWLQTELSWEKGCVLAVGVRQSVSQSVICQF